MQRIFPPLSAFVVLEDELGAHVCQAHTLLLNYGPSPDRPFLNYLQQKPTLLPLRQNFIMYKHDYPQQCKPIQLRPGRKQSKRLGVCQARLCRHCKTVDAGLGWHGLLMLEPATHQHCPLHWSCCSARGSVCQGLACFKPPLFPGSFET